MSLRVLDLFCGAGGAAMGLHRAMPTAEIIGVDIEPQPRYPFRFIRADAMTFCLDDDEAEFDFIWASPPCQRYSRATAQQRQQGVIYPDLVASIRQRLIESGVPWILENVPLAPLIDPIVLCGQQFGLRVLRHRLFEASFPLIAPRHRSHTGLIRGVDKDFVVAVSNAYKKSVYRDDTVGVWKEALGIDWMTKRELSQSIPPAYSQYLGYQFLAHRMLRKAA